MSVLAPLVLIAFVGLVLLPRAMRAYDEEPQAIAQCWRCGARFLGPRGVGWHETAAHPAEAQTWRDP
mgnify:CR=1 FL=1